MEYSFFYIIAMLDAFLNRTKQRLTKYRFGSLFAVSTCVYDKLTNDCPIGNWYWAQLFRCSRLRMLEKELRFMQSLNFELTIEHKKIADMKAMV